MDRWLGLTMGVLLAACAPPAAGTGEGGSSDTSGGDFFTTTDVYGSSTFVGEPTTGSGGGGHFVCEGSSSGFNHETGHGDSDPGEVGGSGGGEDGTDGMADDLPIGALVSEVRMGEFTAGTKVEITDFVVSTPVVPLASGGGWLFYGQMAAGGPRSGIPVVVLYDDPILDTLVPGSAMRIIAVVATRGGGESLWVHPGEGGELLHGADGPAPEPAVFTTEDLVGGGMAYWYDAVLVRIESIEVEDPDICAGEFAVEGGVKIDDLFLGDLAPTPAVGASFGAVIGPLFDNAAGVEVAPRSPDDLVP